MKKSQLCCLAVSFLVPLLACAPFGAPSPTDRPIPTSTPMPTWTPVPTSVFTPEPTTGVIIGTVIDSGTGVPVPAASVSTNPPTSSVTADDEGIYSIPNVRPGEYTIVATKPSYANASVRISVVAGSTTTADLHLAQTATPDHTLTESLLAYYPFDGNADDESGNGYDGDVQGEINYVDGIVGEAVNFDGSGEKIRTDFTLGADFSILLWGFTKDGNYDDYLMISASDPSGHWLLLVDAIRQNDGRFLIIVNSDFIDTTYVVTKNQWVHYSIVREDDRVHFFVNGELLMSEPCGSESISNLVLGGHPSDTGAGATERYVGMLDDVRIYSRALSETEVQMVMKSID